MPDLEIISRTTNKKNISFWLVILFLVIIVNIALFAFLKYGQNKVSRPVLSTPSTSFFPEEKIDNPTTVVPWPDANLKLDTEPATPSAQELNSIYLSVRQAISKRDKDTLLNLVSQEKIWHMNNQKKVGGGTADGPIVFVKIISEDITGKLPEMHWTAPEVDEITPIKVNPDPINSVAEFILLDETTGKSERVINTPWRYVAKVVYESKKDAIYKGTGEVAFVFDRGKWRYQGEYWVPQERNMAYYFGDSDIQKNVYEINLNEQGIFFPEILTISKGDAVVWKNIDPGFVYSYSTDTGVHWNSPFLMKGDTFTHVFNQSGYYDYYIERSQGRLSKGSIHIE